MCKNSPWFSIRNTLQKLRVYLLFLRAFLVLRYFMGILRCFAGFPHTTTKSFVLLWVLQILRDFICTSVYKILIQISLLKNYPSFLSKEYKSILNSSSVNSKSCFNALLITFSYPPVVP